jgi:hypothetical protein
MKQNLNFIIIFDIPLNFHALKLRINRRLKTMNAKMIQRSVWGHNSLKELVAIAEEINKKGGNAFVLKKNILFPKS